MGKILSLVMMLFMELLMSLHAQKCAGHRGSRCSLQDLERTGDEIGKSRARGTGISRNNG